MKTPLQQKKDTYIAVSCAGFTGMIVGGCLGVLIDLLLYVAGDVTDARALVLTPLFFIFGIGLSAMLFWEGE